MSSILIQTIFKIEKYTGGWMTEGLLFVTGFGKTCHLHTKTN